jgi:DNA-binding MarR family transcriptional regulator
MPSAPRHIGEHVAGKVLEDVSSSTGFMLTQLGQESMRRARETLVQHGLKPRQLRILDLLADRGAIGQRELGELMAIDQSILVNLLNPLETDGLVKRERDATDRRRHVVTVTTAGKRRLTAAAKAFQDVENVFFSALTGQQHDELRSLLETLQHAVEDGSVDACE